MKGQQTLDQTVLESDVSVDRETKKALSWHWWDEVSRIALTASILARENQQQRQSTRWRGPLRYVGTTDIVKK